MDEMTQSKVEPIKEIKKDVKRLVVVVIAAVLMAVNIKLLVRNGKLYPGGATGLTILLQTVFEDICGIKVPYAAINIILNAFPAYIGFKFIGKRFTIFSVIMILVNSFVVDMIPAYVVTKDILLISVFGGIINGVAISMCLMVDATSGGTDFISIYLSQKRGVDSFNIILGFNVVILVTAGILFGWDKALYSIIFQYASTQTIHLLYRNYQQVTLYVVTDHPKEICNEIYKICKHGATIIDAHGSFKGGSTQLVYSVINATDQKYVIKAINEIDSNAFVNCMNTQQVTGNFYYRPRD